jgi:hypothetical protein
MDIKCTQCGAKVPIETETTFIRCPYCETALYVDADQTVKHYYLPPQASLQDLGPMIGRKLSYMEIKDPVTITSASLLYFPFWRLDAGGGTAISIPAAMPPVEDLFNIKMPAGDLKVFSPELAVEHEVAAPELLLEEARTEAQKMVGSESAQFTSAAIVHLPLYQVDYVCRDKRHAAVVETVSGNVYADDWPSGPQKEKDRVLGLIAILAFALFALEAAFIPWLPIVFLAFALSAAGIYFLSISTLRRMGW